MTCNGCQHYKPTYQVCRKLEGRLYCKACKLSWHVIDDGVRCHGCSEYQQVIEMAACEDDKPPRWCPGFEAIPPIVGQRTLFD